MPCRRGAALAGPGALDHAASRQGQPVQSIGVDATGLAPCSSSPAEAVQSRLLASHGVDTPWLASRLLHTLPLLPMPIHQRAGRRPSMKTKRYFFPGIITAGLLVLGLLADCGSAAIRARSIFVESADVVAGIGRAERECRQLMAALASARAAAMHADVPQLYSDLHFHMALVDDALVQVESMSAMAISSGWSRLVQQDRLAPQDVERTGPALERREARDALRSAVHALAASCARLISAARSFKALEAQAITVLDEDFSPHGLESIKPLLTTLLAD